MKDSQPSNPKPKPQLPTHVCHECKEEYTKGNTYYLCNSCAGELRRAGY